MAKSLRSKRERKLRRIKRVRYGKKELQRLKTMLGITDTTTDAEMKNLEDVATGKNSYPMMMRVECTSSHAIFSQPCSGWMNLM